MIRLCRKTRSGFERLVFRLPVPMYIGSCIDDRTNPPSADFAVLARRKTARSRADDGVFRQSLVLAPYRFTEEIRKCIATCSHRVSFQ